MSEDISLKYGTPIWKKATTGPTVIGRENQNLIPLYPSTEETDVFVGASAVDGECIFENDEYKLLHIQPPQGRIWVRCKGPIEVGDTVGRSVGNDYLEKDGTPSVGIAQGAINGTEDPCVIPVLVGAGGGGTSGPPVWG